MVGAGVGPEISGKKIRYYTDYTRVADNEHMT